MEFGLRENTYLFFLLVFCALFAWLGSLYTMEHPMWFGQPHFSTEEILRSRSLVHRLHAAEYKNAQIESEITLLSHRASQMLDAQAPEQTHSLMDLMGLIKQEGPGLEVVLKDNDRPLLLGDNPNTGIVHNSTLVQMANYLRVAGASAVAINGQPVNTLTPISCSGPIIVVNNTRITSPFTLQALGNPDTLERGLSRARGFMQYLRENGISVSIRHTTVSIPPQVIEGSGF